MAWAGRNRETVCPRKDEQSIGNAEESREDQWNGLVLVHAQKAVQGFWERVGFVMDEELGIWWEEGLEHVGMWSRASMLQ
jgi:predicted GNAT family N-acyltransferase